MFPDSQSNQLMSKYNIIAFTGVGLAITVYLIFYDQLKESSPLGIVAIAIAGILLTIKFRLAGDSLLLFSGLALTVHPFLFPSTYWLIPCGMLISYSGFAGLIKWWNKDN